MKHDDTLIILMFFEKSKPKIYKAIDSINKIISNRTILRDAKLGMIFQIIEGAEMNQMVFKKSLGKMMFDQCDYERSLFEELRVRKYEVEFKTQLFDSSYLHGSVLFKMV